MHLLIIHLLPFNYYSFRVLQYIWVSCSRLLFIHNIPPTLLNSSQMHILNTPHQGPIHSHSVFMSYKLLIHTWSYIIILFFYYYNPFHKLCCVIHHIHMIHSTVLSAHKMENITFTIFRPIRLHQFQLNWEICINLLSYVISGFFILKVLIYKYT